MKLISRSASALLAAVALVSLAHGARLGRTQEQLEDMQDQLDDMAYMNALRQLQEAQRQSAPQSGQRSRPSTWQYIATSTDGRHFTIDTTSITMNNGVVSFEYDASGNVPRYYKNLTYFSSFTSADINCRARTIDRKKEIFFSKSNKVIGEVDYTRKAVPIGQNTIESMFATYLCR